MSLSAPNASRPATAASIGAFVAVIAVFVMPTGCAINAEPDFDSAVPQDRFLAIREAAATRDQRAVPDLIRQLSVDDPLARRAAIDALEAITGQTLGYEPNAPEIERRRAIDRWVQWPEQPAAAANPTEAAS